MSTVENTTRSFPLIGKLIGKTTWRTDWKSRNRQAVKGFIALLLCFLAGAATALLLLYTFF